MKWYRFSLIFCAMALTIPTHPMGAFFRVPVKPLFSTMMNGLQWAYFVLEAAKNLHYLKKNYDFYDAVLYASHLYSDDKDYSLYVQRLLNDERVRVVRHASTHGSSYHNPFSGNKVIILPPENVPEAVIFHEYEHIKKSHLFKQSFVALLTPLVTLSLFKGMHHVYKIARYGYERARKITPSVGSILLKIPSMCATNYASSYLFPPILNAYSRSHEREADAAIPAHLAGDCADYLLSKASSIDELFTNSDSHPSLYSRINMLRERAANAHQCLPSALSAESSYSNYIFGPR